MRTVAALLAAASLASLAACGDGGAEPGAPDGATRDASLVLDFQPNAVHSGLYAAQAGGHFADEGLDLEIVEPTGTADGAKLLEAGRADFAILDINDFGIARERGFDIVAIAAIVQRPLAAVIAREPERIRTPADLEGATVGVTGVPSDDAVLDTVLAGAGLPPDAVERKTIGFQSVRLLASGEVDAATAFWNSEGVELRRQGIETREFRVDEFGAPRFPELVVVATDERAAEGEVTCALSRGLERGYHDLDSKPGAAPHDLLAANPELDPEGQRAQMDALLAGHAFDRGKTGATIAIDMDAVAAWARWRQDPDILRADDQPIRGC